MSTQREEIRAAMIRMIEEEMEQLLAWEESTEKVTMGDIEKQVLAARQRVGQQMVQKLVDVRAERLDASMATPKNEQGKALHYKGKKTKPAKRRPG
jgi:glutamyl-tRNA reductase